jgi:translation initiation factor IF-2
VQHGTLKVGDYMLAGHHGIKAMYDERGNIVNCSFNPVSVLGLDGAATAGDKFNVFEDEKKQNNVCVLN